MIEIISSTFLDYEWWLQNFEQIYKVKKGTVGIHKKSEKFGVTIGVHVQNKFSVKSVLNTKSSVTELSNLAVVYYWETVVISGLDHPVNQLPLSGEGFELQDFISGGIVKTT